MNFNLPKNPDEMRGALSVHLENHEARIGHVEHCIDSLKGDMADLKGNDTHQNKLLSEILEKVEAQENIRSGFDFITKCVLWAGSIASAGYTLYTVIKNLS